MEFVKSQFDRIQRQLNGLSASQKMLTASLVAIMVMTLMMWGRYAGEAEYVPVLGQSFSQDELSRISTELTAKGIPFKPDGAGRILVPEDKRVQALAHISYGQMLPSNFASSFDEVVKSLNPFESSSISAAKLNQAKNNTLGAIIGAFEPVKTAVVVIDASAKRTIGADVQPSATITILLKQPRTTPAAVIQKTVNAAADVVIGAHAGLQPDRIKVNVEGVPHKVHSADAAGGMDGSDQLAAMEKGEEYFERRIREHLGYIQPLQVKVSVAVDADRKEELKESFQPDGSVSLPTQETTENTQTTSGAPQVGEPGVASNLGMEINSGAAPGGVGASTTQESTETKYENRIGRTIQKIATPAGMVTPVAASVQIPRSYIVSILKKGKADAPEPDDAAIEDRTKLLSPAIKTAVLGCAAFKSADAVSVSVYEDFAGGGPSFAGAAETAVASSVPLLIGGHAKEIALGVLAAVSLFMVSMMVRKSAPVPVRVAAAPVPTGPTTLDANEELAGEVSGGDPMLEGMELNDDAIKTQQILDQVTEMVTEDPDSAANLVKRWMNRA